MTTLAPIPTLAAGFVHPALFAAGVACVAIPILIHLLMRRRRKPKAWAAMRFLLEAYRKQRRRLKLEQFLLLAARCLVVLLIALALGRPVLSAAGLLGRGSTTLYILLDNSLAASATNAEGESALQRHQRAAKALIAELSTDSGDRAAIVTLGGPADPIALPPSSDLSAIEQLIDRVGTTDSAADVPGALTAVRAAMDEETDAGGRVVVAMLSDFLEGSARTSATLGGAGADRSEDAPPIELVATRPASVGAGNVSVMDLRPLRSVVVTTPGLGAEGGSTQLGQSRVRLRRTGEGVGARQIVNVRLIAMVGDARTPLGRATATFEPGQTETTVTIAPTTDESLATRGAAVLVAEIDRDPIAGDNTRRRAVALRESIRVGLVAPPRLGGGPGVASFTPGDWLRLALEPTGDAARSTLEVASIDPSGVDAARLAGLDAVIIATPERLQPAAWTRLATFVRGGGLLVVTPAADESVQVWTEAFTRELGLRWTIAREPETFDTPRALSSTTSVDPATDPLALVRTELTELAPAVIIERALPIELAPESGFSILEVDDAPFVVAGAPSANDGARGLVVLFAAAPDLAWTNLPAKPLMVPLIHELVRQGVGRARGGSTSIAGSAPMAPASAIELRARDGDTVRLSNGVAERAIRRAGVWEAIDRRGRVADTLVVNASTNASVTDVRSEDEIAEWLATAGLGAPRWIESGATSQGDPDAEVASASLGETGDSSLSWPLLIAAAIFAAFEMALARFASHAGLQEATREEAAA